MAAFCFPGGLTSPVAAQIADLTEYAVRDAKMRRRRPGLRHPIEHGQAEICHRRQRLLSGSIPEVTLVHALDVRSSTQAPPRWIRIGGRALRCEIDCNPGCSGRDMEFYRSRARRPVPVDDLCLDKAEAECVRTSQQPGMKLPVPYVALDCRSRIFRRCIMRREPEPHAQILDLDRKSVFLESRWFRFRPVDVRSMPDTILKILHMWVVHLMLVRNQLPSTGLR